MYCKTSLLTLVCLAFTVTSQSNNNEETEAQLQALHKQLLAQEARLQQQEVISQKLQNDVITQKQQILRLETLLESKDEDGFVGFTVYQTEPRNYSAGEVIQFHGVITNYGSFFNTTSSTFTCPVSGYYLFTASVMNANDYGAEMDIVIAETRVAVTYARDMEIFHQASNAAIVYCEAGQVAWAKNRQNGDRIHGFTDFSYTSFSGVLLRRILQP